MKSYKSALVGTALIAAIAGYTIKHSSEDVRQSQPIMGTIERSTPQSGIDKISLQPSSEKEKILELAELYNCPFPKGTIEEIYSMDKSLVIPYTPMTTEILDALEQSVTTLETGKLRPTTNSREFKRIQSYLDIYGADCQVED